MLTLYGGRSLSRVIENIAKERQEAQIELSETTKNINIVKDNIAILKRESKQSEWTAAQLEHSIQYKTTRIKYLEEERQSLEDLVAALNRLEEQVKVAKRTLKGVDVCGLK